MLYWVVGLKGGEGIIEKKNHSLLFDVGNPILHICNRIYASLGFILNWLTSGLQIIVFLAIIPIAPLPLVWLMLTYPRLGAILVFVFAFGYVTRDEIPNAIKYYLTRRRRNIKPS